MKNKVLLLGKLGEDGAGLSGVVRAAGLEPVEAPSSQEAFAVLAGDDVCSVVYQADSSAVEAICTAVRGNPRFDGVALVAFVRQTDRAALGPVFSTGADDYLPASDPGDLEDKLRELRAHATTGRPSFIKGRAVLADTGRQWRVQAARVLRQASYDVHFAVDHDEVARVLERDPTIQLVVADTSLPGGSTMSLLEGLRRRGHDRPVWIGCGSAAERVTAEARLAAAGSAAFHDRATPPENLTFLINATTMTPARSQRASARLLYSVPVSFEILGRPGVVWGSTYNVSRAGLYVRTLTPAPFGAELRLRLHAPGDGPEVELRARRVAQGVRRAGRRPGTDRDGRADPRRRGHGRPRVRGRLRSPLRASAPDRAGRVGGSHARAALPRAAPAGKAAVHLPGGNPYTARRS